jgi:hypothetical protein
MSLIIHKSIIKLEFKLCQQNQTRNYNRSEAFFLIRGGVSWVFS